MLARRLIQRSVALRGARSVHVEATKPSVSVRIISGHSLSLYGLLTLVVPGRHR